MNTNLIPQSAVAVCNGAVRTSSIEIAKAFNKEHYNVCRDIEQIMSQVVDNAETLKFEGFETTYKNNLGKDVKQRAYYLNKNAFMLLVMGFTGDKAMQIKISFIKLFDFMEMKLCKLSVPSVKSPTSFVPEATYYGVPVISLSSLAQRLNVTRHQIHAALQNNRAGVIDQVELFRVKSNRELSAAGCVPAWRRNTALINLFTEEGARKIRDYVSTLMLPAPAPAPMAMTPAVPERQADLNIRKPFLEAVVYSRKGRTVKLPPGSLLAGEEVKYLLRSHEAMRKFLFDLCIELHKVILLDGKKSDAGTLMADLIDEFGTSGIRVE